MIGPLRPDRGGALQARPPSSAARQQLGAILADLAERAIRPTILNVIAHALDVGIPEPVAVELATLVGSQNGVAS